MAFTVYDMEDDVMAVLWAYDDVPVRVFESTLASLNNVSYYIDVYRYDKDNDYDEEYVTRLRAYPNVNGYGVFNLRNTMAACVRLAGSQCNDVEYDGTFGSSNRIPSANNQVRIKLVYGYCQNASCTIQATTYHWVVAGFVSDVFTSSVDGRAVRREINGDNQGGFLSVRPVLPYFTFQNKPTQVAYVADNDRYSVSFFATDNTTGSEWDTTLGSIRVQIDAAFSVGENIVLTKQSVSTTVAPTTPNAHECLRELPCGPWDIVNFKDSGGNYLYNATTRGLISSGAWTRIRVYGASPGGDIEGKTYVRLERAQDNNIDGCNTTVQLKFMNKLGGYDYISCFAHTQQSMEMTRDIYAKQVGKYNTANNTTPVDTDDPFKRKRVSQVTDVRQILRVSTGHIDENENPLVEAMLTSREVLATRFVKNGQGHGPEFYPVIVKDTSFSYMYKETEKVIEYTFTIEYANQLKPIA